MSIKLVLNSLMLAMSVAAVAAMGQLAAGAMTEWRQAEALATGGEASGYLLQAAKSLAVERGLEAGALGGEDRIAEGVAKRVAESRRAGDQALTQAFPLAAENSGPVAELLRDLEARRQLVAALRPRVDQAVSLAKAERDPALAKEWFTRTSAVIEGVLSLRLRLLQAQPQIDKVVRLSEELRGQLALMAEFAGRERGYINGALMAGRPLVVGDFQVVGEMRGRVLGSWGAVGVLGAEPELVAIMEPALARIDREYFHEFESLRQRVYGAGGGGAAVSGADWFAAATAAMESITAAQLVADGLAREAIAAHSHHATVVLVACVAAMAIVLALTALNWGVVQGRVSRPILLLERLMTQMASGNLAVQIPWLKRRDEIGAMAQTLAVFRDNMAEASRLREEQRLAEQRLRDERRRVLHELAGQVHTDVGLVAEEIASAVSQLYGHAVTMADLAGEARNGSAAAGSASRNASQNIQSVASATEELSASVAEISRQVVQSAEKSDMAVADLEHTSQAMTDLREAVTKVREVTGLIFSIAAQTNMLALNATIEAARAGEAGKGFAVVAGEVKGLATQTARATHEISAQIEAIEAVSNKAAEALRTVCTSIAGIHDSATSVAAAVEQQGAATEEIARSVQQGAGEVAQVDENVAGAAAASTEAHRQADQLRAAADSLQGLSSRLYRATEQMVEALRAA